MGVCTFQWLDTYLRALTIPLSSQKKSHRLSPMWQGDTLHLEKNLNNLQWDCNNSFEGFR